MNPAGTRVSRAQPCQYSAPATAINRDPRATWSLRLNKFATVLGDIGIDGKGDVTAPGYVWYVWYKGQ